MLYCCYCVAHYDTKRFPKVIHVFKGNNQKHSVFKGWRDVYIRTKKLQKVWIPETPRPSSLVAIPAIAWATSLNRTTVARAIAAAIATVLRRVAAAIANKYVIRNVDQSNGEKAFRISPTSFNTTLLIGWFYPGSIPNNGMAVRHQLSPQANPLLVCSLKTRNIKTNLFNSKGISADFKNNVKMTSKPSLVQFS